MLCPVCNRVTMINNLGEEPKFCSYCGQGVSKKAESASATPFPRITYVQDQPPPTPSSVINGLHVSVSPDVQDSIALFHLGFDKCLEVVRLFTQLQAPAPGKVVPFTSPETEPGPDETMMPHGMSPLARAAWYEAQGMTPPSPPGEERPEDHPAYKEMDEALKGVLGDVAVTGKGKVEEVEE